MSHSFTRAAIADGLREMGRIDGDKGCPRPTSAVFDATGVPARTVSSDFLRLRECLTPGLWTPDNFPAQRWPAAISCSSRGDETMFEKLDASFSSRARRVSPRVLWPLLALPLSLMLPSRPVHAQCGPSAPNCTIPCGINLVGTSHGVPDVKGAFTVTIRDFGNNPIANCDVCIDFNGCLAAFDQKD